MSNKKENINKRYIAPDYDNYYDSFYENEDGTIIPIVNISDYYARKITNETIASINNDFQLTNFDKVQSINTIKNQSDLATELYGGKDFVSSNKKEIEDDASSLNSEIRFKFPDLTEEGYDYLAATFNSDMNKFRNDFPDFLYATNKSISELSSENNMLKLIERFEKVYKENLEINNDEIMSEQMALKTVLGGAIKEKLANEEVKIPTWFTQDIQNDFLDYNIGITNVDNPIETEMFHNDNFSRIIDTFKKYRNIKDKTFSTKPVWQYDTADEIFESDESYQTFLQSLINKKLNVMNKGAPITSKGQADAMAVGIESLLFNQSLYELHNYNASGEDPYKALWWMKEIPYNQKLQDLYKRKKFGNLIPQIYDEPTDWLSKTKLRWNPDSKIKKIGKNILKKAGRVVNPIRKLGFVEWSLTDGVDIGKDLLVGLKGGFGYFNEFNPQTSVGREFFDTIGMFNPDEGEIGHDEEGYLKEGSEFIWNQMFGGFMPSLDKSFGFTRNEAIDFGNQLNHHNKIYKNISYAIVEGYNRNLNSQIKLKEVIKNINYSIKNSPEYISIVNKEEKKKFYIQEFYNKAFRPKASNFDEQPNEYENGMFQPIFKDYVDSYILFEGGMHLIHKTRIGAKSKDASLNVVPIPQGFPPELWEDLTNIAKMDKDTYKSLYGKVKPSGKKEWINSNYGDIFRSDKSYHTKEEGSTSEFINIAKSLYYKSSITPNHAVHIVHPIYGHSFDIASFKRVNMTYDDLYANSKIAETNKIIEDFPQINDKE